MGGTTKHAFVPLGRGCFILSWRRWRYAGDLKGNQMSYQYERYRERPRSSGLRRMVVGLTILVWALLIGIVLVRFVARPLLTGYLQERLSQMLPAGASPGNVLPAGLPSGNFSISEADANQWLAQNREQFQGVDDIRLRFFPGQTEASLTMSGVTSTARAGVMVVNGQVVITDPVLDPPLGLIVDVEPFARLLQDQLNRDLATVGQTVTGIRVEQGQLLIEVQ